MLQRENQARMQVQQLLDASLALVAFWFAYTLRAHPLIAELLHRDDVAPMESFVWFFPLIFLAAPLVLESQGYYDRPVFSPRRLTVWPLFKGCLVLALGLTLLFFFFKMYLARAITVWFGAGSFLLILLKDEALRLGYRAKLTQAQLRRRVILVGEPADTARFRSGLEKHPEEAMVAAAELDLAGSSVTRLVELLHEHSANGVILCARHVYFEQVEAVIRACEVEGIEAWLVADFFQTQLSQTTLDEFLGRPVMIFRTTPEASWQNLLKQLMDYVGAFLLLLVAIPLFIAIAIAIKCSSPGPVFFRQKRSGLNGQPFSMLKFRTMVTNAEQLQAELAALNEMSGPVFKVTNDPRVTRCGNFLRQTSLDELPQLWNVLRGEMSLVGPRPLPVTEVARFDDVAHRRRLSVRPGLTCLWQVRGRNSICDFKEWVRLDLEYIDSWSLWLDVKILLQTIPAVLFRSGAK
jgi:exopolysaccharide biosynthesis polyprenyl glycosylphosphotransferase